MIGPSGHRNSDPHATHGGGGDLHGPHGLGGGRQQDRPVLGLMRDHKRRGEGRMGREGSVGASEAVISTWPA